MNYLYKIAALTLLLASISCATVIKKMESENNYNRTKNLQSKESVFKIKKDTKGNLFAELTSPYIYAYTFSGDFIETETEVTFNISKVRIFANSNYGFSEGEAESSGTIVFTKTDTGFKAKVLDVPEIGDFTYGRIKYSGNYIIGDKALNQIRNRYDRIKAVNEFLKTKNIFPKFFGHPWINNEYGKSYKNQVKAYLFPELFGKAKSDEYKITDLSNDTVLNEEVLWNKKYTENIFPKNLIEVRNSGTMLRDFDEGTYIFYSDYNANYYFNEVLNNSSFIVGK